MEKNSSSATHEVAGARGESFDTPMMIFVSFRLSRILLGAFGEVKAAATTTGWAFIKLSKLYKRKFSILG
jgi:hypothetical protein